MKIETILSALCISRVSDPDNPRRFRQFNKFYDRILKVDAEKDKRIVELEEEVISESKWADHYFKLWQDLGGMDD